jgi:bidirectional [NiFe] hydrogenase diaphorase subunit
MSTPPAPTPGVVTFKIDDKDLSATSEQTILEVARENAIPIPTLCFLDGLTPWGGCRLCLVEVKGTSKLLPACVTRVAEGMEVTTDTPRLRKYRRMILELLFTERNHICSVCVSNGHCELQSAAARLELDHVSMPYRFPAKEQGMAFDSSHDLFRLDHNRCILCTRCVRVCDEIEGAHTWDVRGRGIEARVVVDLDQPWGQSESCTLCGKCVNVCPTGALSRKGTGVAEMEKRPDFLAYLRVMRGAE